MTAAVFLTAGWGWCLAAALVGLALFGLTAVVSSKRDHRRLDEWNDKR